ncbi:hypothetical protein [Leptotrichia sp. oral taxon 223]|uniref:hypothetical protein n=1 Tax=Leptotrichia sp. oral taxon 223 TaxID=712363 RepID=UPI0015C06968|nr:hypothetical protein [Leptotrichia sp. oral taxon 223]NWO20182.1 hypothetical protein [Leptotrichia sp. oral taxon 223]
MRKQTPKIKGTAIPERKKAMEVSESWIRKQATKLQLTIKEAAEFVGKGQQYVRVGLQTGRLKFGTAIPKFKDEKDEQARRRAGKHNWDYDIQRIQVEKYVGITYEEFLKMKFGGI